MANSGTRTFSYQPFEMTKLIYAVVHEPDTCIEEGLEIRRTKVTSEEIISKIRSVFDKQWVDATAAGPQAIGDTLEFHLGLPRTNLQAPDWGDFELKTGRIMRPSPVTLISQMPILSRRKSMDDVIRKYGVYRISKKRYHLYDSVKGHMETKQGWKLHVNSKRNRIEYRKKGELVAFQNFIELKRRFEKKLPNLVYVKAFRRVEGKQQLFKYIRAYLFQRIRFDWILQALKDGKMQFDWRIHEGIDEEKLRDHGPAYRIKVDSILDIFEEGYRLPIAEVTL